MDSIPPDATTIEALLRERDWVARLARGLARDPHAADDLEQESWLDTLLRPPRHAANLRSWLSQRVRHTFRSSARGDARRVQREALAARADVDSETQAAVDRAELAREMVEIVLKLEEPYRSALVLVYLEGLTPGEVARRQGLPASTVRSHVQRGLERVRSELARRRRDWRDALAALAIVREPATLLMSAGTAAKFVGAAAALILAIWGIRAWQSDPLGPAPLASGPSVALADARKDAAAPIETDARTAIGDQPVAIPQQLRPGLRIRAVHERDGAPLADAALRVRWFDSAWRGRRWYLRTDADGRAELPGALPGRNVVESDHGGWAEGVVDATNGLDLELRVDDRLAVTGRVIDPRGAPVAGASVRVGWNSNPESDVEVAVSDAKGRFAFQTEGDGRSVGAWHPDHAASPRARLERDAQATARELVLPLGASGATLSARVLDPDGKPVANAWVRHGQDRAPEVSLPDGSRAAPPGGWAVQCDESGLAIVRGLPPGATVVMALDDGRPSTTTTVELQAGATSEIELRFAQGAGLHGVVRDKDGNPVGNALLRVADGSDPRFPLRLGQWECWQDADANGAFDFDGLRPGARRILADGGPRGRVVFDVVLADGVDASVDPVVDAGRIVRGRVTDVAGLPLEGWRVRAETVQVGGRIEEVELDELMGWPSEWGSTKTDARGEFVLANQLACQLSLTVSGPDIHDRTARLVREDVRAGGEPLELVVDTQALSGWIAGRLLDPTGAPVRGVISVWRDDDSFSKPIQEFEADPITGRFRAGPLLKGVYRVSAKTPAWPQLNLDPVGVGSKEKDVGDLRLVEPGSLRITVRTQGVPEHELQVSVHGPSDTRPVAVVEGRASIDGLAPGTYRLQLVRGGRPSSATRSPMSVEVESRGTTNVELVADPP